MAGQGRSVLHVVFTTDSSDFESDDIDSEEVENDTYWDSTIVEFESKGNCQVNFRGL